MNSYEVLPPTVDRKALLKCESSVLGSHRRGGGREQGPQVPRLPQLHLHSGQGSREMPALSCLGLEASEGLACDSEALIGKKRLYPVLPHGWARPHLLPRGPSAFPGPCRTTLSSAGCLTTSLGFSQASWQTLSISASVSLSA